jgi:cytochrome c-type biogenesis protein
MKGTAGNGGTGLKSSSAVLAAGLLHAFIAGAAFGAGWTPCIGPILTAILLMAARSGAGAVAVFYLAVYSLGFAIPFLLAAVFFDFFIKSGRRLHSYLPLIRRISGILLIVIGLTILTGRYSALNVLIQRWIFSYIVWADGRAFPFELFARLLAWLQTF